MSQHVIIGSGVAGVSAAQAIRLQDAAAQITLVSDDPHGYYSRPGMAYYLTGEQSDRFLFPLSSDHFKQLNVRMLRERVIRIDPQQHSILCSSQRALSYDRLLIATGSSAARLAVPGSDLEGVVKLDDLEDARRMLKLARRGRTAGVVGGGITALELVEGFLARGMHVHLFMHGERYWNSVLDETESNIIEGRLKAEKVQIHGHIELEEVLGKQGKISAVRSKDGRTFNLDLLAVAIGVRPVKDLAQACGLKVDRGVLVDPYMQTNLPDIFAAGDVAQVYDAVSGKWLVESLWAPAARQGECAGLNMAGAPTAYIQERAANVTRLTGLTTAIIGSIGRERDEDLLSITHGDSESWRDSPEAIVTRADYDINHLRILVGEKVLVGAVIMGDQSLAPIVRALVAGQVDILPIRQALILPGAPVADLIKDFWKGLSSNGNATKRE